MSVEEFDKEKGSAFSLPECASSVECRDELTFFLCVPVLPGVEVHQLLPPLLPHLPLQCPLVGGLAVRAGLGAFVPSRDFHPALLVLLLFLSLQPLSLRLL